MSTTEKLKSTKREKFPKHGLAGEQQILKHKKVENRESVKDEKHGQTTEKSLKNEEHRKILKKTKSVGIRKILYT